MMVDRKAALIACADGQWIRTRGMRGLRLEALVQPDTLLELIQILDTEWGPAEARMRFSGPGTYPVEDADWSRLIVIGGPSGDALCVFLGGSNALSSV